eukprot:SM000108S14225  [mRNA]  locus=s108:371287:374028:+ [translate_table: standard]
MRLFVPLAEAFDGRLGLALGSAIPFLIAYALQARGRRAVHAAAASTSAATADGGGAGADPRARRPDEEAGRRPVANGFPAHADRSDGLAPAATGKEPGSALDSHSAGWKEVECNKYDAESNPDGCIQLGIADNKVSLDLIESRLLGPSSASAWAAGEGCMNLAEMASYPTDSFGGTAIFRKALASLLMTVAEDRFDVDPEHIVAASGASAILEVLAFILGPSPTDAFLVPAPYYTGFDLDVAGRPGVKLVPAFLQSADGFCITQQSLEEAYRTARLNGSTVKAIAVTSPANPIGRVLTADELQTLLDFAEDRGLHIISDEIYAGSCFGKPSFTSAAELVPPEHPHAQHVHIVYGLSKDLGLPGFRVGVLYSRNKEVLARAAKMTRFCAVSSPCQALLAPLLQDQTFWNDYLKEYHQRLLARYQIVVEALNKLGVGYVEANAGFFVFVYLRPFLVTSDQAGEEAFFERLLYDLGLFLNPGGAWHCNEPGWFRLCFAAVDEATLKVAMRRLQQLVAHRNGRRR